jgi:MFS family permease
VFQLGAALATLGLLELGLVHDTPTTVAIGGAVLGLAYGFAFGSLGSLVIDATPPTHTGAATGINTILRTVGGALGSVIAVAILTATTAGTTSTGTTPPTESGYTTAFLVSAAIALSAAHRRHGSATSARTSRISPRPVSSPGRRTQHG